jgi:hypothetical protein
VTHRCSDVFETVFPTIFGLKIDVAGRNCCGRATPGGVTDDAAPSSWQVIFLERLAAIR